MNLYRADSDRGLLARHGARGLKATGWTPTSGRRREPGSPGINARDRRGRGGFTLIELLAVMAIMVLMTVISITSYFGATRGAAMRGAISHLQDTLSLARQSAIMQRRSAYVLFNSGGKTNSYVICMHQGTGTGGGSRLDLDEFDNAEGLVDNAEVYNLELSRKSIITDVGEPDPATGRWRITTADPIWSGDSKYGWPANPALQLPNDFSMEINASAPAAVVFRHDGTVRPQGYRIKVREYVGARGHGEVVVKGPEGFVSSAIVEGE